jgi:hypothetical protein
MSKIYISGMTYIILLDNTLSMYHHVPWKFWHHLTNINKKSNLLSCIHAKRSDNILESESGKCSAHKNWISFSSFIQNYFNCQHFSCKNIAPLPKLFFLLNFERWPLLGCQWPLKLKNSFRKSEIGCRFLLNKPWYFHIYYAIFVYQSFTQILFGGHLAHFRVVNNKIKNKIYL